jgi:hypothetical protein
MPKKRQDAYTTLMIVLLLICVVSLMFGLAAFVSEERAAMNCAQVCFPAMSSLDHGVCYCNDNWRKQ